MNGIVITHEGEFTSFPITMNRGCAPTREFANSSREVCQSGGISVAYDPHKVSKAAVTEAINQLTQLSQLIPA